MLRSVARQQRDFIVLGAGSAGCVVAKRLAESANVLLLEAGLSDRGKWDSWKIHMPSALTFNLANDKYNWDYHTTPQAGLGGRVLHQPRGKGLGGSSSLNAMAYIRGHAMDYERWEAEGADGWSYADCLPYFRKAQNHVLGADDYRGGEGPFHTARPRTAVTEPLSDAFVAAGVEAGWPRTADQNGYMQEGFGSMDASITPAGSRASISTCYLLPERSNPRLEVRTGYRVHRLVVQAGKCIGVDVVGPRGAERLSAGEVICCLGAVGSPQVLQLSGIGPAAALEALGVDCVQDLPVGENLQDHLEVYVQYECTQPVSLYPYAATYPWPESIKQYLFRKPLTAARSGANWLARGAGVAASNHFEVGGFIRTTPDTPHPDVQYHFIAGCVTGQLDFLPRHGYQAHCGTLRPTATGTVTLASADPTAAPIIDPNFLGTDHDVVDMRNALRETLKIMEQPALAPFRGNRLSPDNRDMSDAEVDEWVRQNSHSGYHLSCTCAMGTVTDSHGRVNGIDGLRVVDASVMPSIVSGNLNAPTVMLAEKLADAIKGTTLPPARNVTWYEREGRKVRSA